MSKKTYYVVIEKGTSIIVKEDYNLIYKKKKDAVTDWRESPICNQLEVVPVTLEIVRTKRKIIR